MFHALFQKLFFSVPFHNTAVMKGRYRYVLQETVSRRTVMEKHYHLKAIQKNHSHDFFSVAATIYLGDRHIGALRTCPETKEIEFEFALPMDRLVFENFISDWWRRADRHFNDELNQPGMIQSYPAHPPLSVRMRYWVESIVLPEPSAVQADEVAAA